MKYARRILLLLIGVTALFVVVFAALIELTPFDASKLTPSSTPTVIYDKNGNRYATIAAPGSNDLPYSSIPQNLQDAVVATEDHNYWSGSSIDIRGILRAAFVDLWRGQLAQGGSTIEEQLAKIVYLTDQKTFSRKISQIILGVQIDRHFSKQEILAMYLNRVYLGEGAVGVKQAAMKYFGVDLSKDPNGLTLAQAALLAGLPQAPSAYDPIQHPKAALARRNQVLENMAKYGYISEAKAKQTEKLSLELSPHSVPGDIWTQHPLFAQFLFDYADKNGISSELLTQGGLKIYTTLDPQVESAIEQVMENGTHFAAPVNGQPVPAAAVFVDPATGGILGAAGARDAQAARGLDRAYENGQPGSSIKPILEYAPAIEDGLITPDSILDNTPHDFGGGYVPQNDEPNQPGQVTVRYALAHSENVAAVSLLQKLGIQRGIQFAEQDGIQFTADDAKHLGIAIGGMQNGVNAVQMAQAYEAFDDQGVQQQVHLISSIVNASGSTIYQFHPSAKRIMSAQTAATMTSLMEDVVQYGTGTGAAVPGWGVAGKTGTVQFDAGLTGPDQSWIRLAWFDGYTPNMVGSIYMGWNYDEPNPAYHMTGSPSYQCSQIFGDIVRLAEEGRTPQTFQGPQVSPSDANAVTNLQAAWDQAAGGVQLTWSSDAAGQVQFVVTRADVTSPAAGGPPQGPAGGPGHGRGKGRGKAGGQAAGGPAASAGAVTLGQTANLSFVDTSVEPGQTYTYTVQAVDPSSGQPVGQPASITLVVNASTPVPNPTGNLPPDNSLGGGAGVQNTLGNDLGSAGNAVGGTGNAVSGIGNAVGGTGGGSAGNSVGSGSGGTSGTGSTGAGPAGGSGSGPAGGGSAGGGSGGPGGGGP
ncbi:MAG: transglycosylase domain-containing protein [Alicyclobacillus sp.]|nr:transglycosylase domain-containing protein [Alicyclobacillus sp.]